MVFLTTQYTSVHTDRLYMKHHVFDGGGVELIFT